MQFYCRRHEEGNRKDLKCKELRTEKENMWNVRTKVIPLNWNHLKITQTIPEQHTGKVRNQGTTKNSHIGHCTSTPESTDVKVQNIQHRK